MKKAISLITCGLLAITMLAGCSKKQTTEITVVTRENGSGTRGAFIELLGIEEKDSNGNKTDNTTGTAVEANKTDIMLTQVSGNKNAIGYVSFGSLNDSVKALKIDGVEISTDTIKDGSYKVARPFNIATKGDLNDATKDFISFIMSKEGQDIIVENKLISSEENAKAYESNGASGKVVVAGSSSVYPVMEKLKEAYMKLNTKVVVEVQMTDSSAGLKAVSEGTVQIGMASRELKDSEKETLNETKIALDGIAVIVNKDSLVTNLSSETIRDIYTGKVTDWTEIK